MAEKQEEWIESDECIKSCGLERMSVGLSTDLLMDSRFTGMLCSSECLNNCPNLIDLYISLAAGEGTNSSSSLLILVKHPGVQKWVPASASE